MCVCVYVCIVQRRPFNRHAPPQSLIPSTLGESKTMTHMCLRGELGVARGIGRGHSKVDQEVPQLKETRGTNARGSLERTDGRRGGDFLGITHVFERYHIFSGCFFVVRYVLSYIFQVCVESILMYSSGQQRRELFFASVDARTTNPPCERGHLLRAFTTAVRTKRPKQLPQE